MELHMNPFKGRHFQRDIILWAVRWYCKYGISYRELQEMLAERGVNVDHHYPYKFHQPVVASIFTGIDARHHTDREGKNHAANHQTQGSYYCGKYASLGHSFFGISGQEIPRNGSCPTVNDKS